MATQNTISASDSKKGRGRPRLMNAECERAMRALYQNMTHRAVQNKAYQSSAWSVLHDNPACNWLFNTGDVREIRSSILAELGRIRSPDLMIQVATAVCVQKPATKAAVALIRKIRTGQKPAADALQLANQVIDLINQYAITHEGCDKETMAAALRTAAHCVVESKDSPNGP